MISGLAGGLGWARRWRWESVYASRGRGRWRSKFILVGRVASGVGVNAEGKVGLEVRGQIGKGGVAKGSAKFEI